MKEERPLTSLFLPHLIEDLDEEARRLSDLEFQLEALLQRTKNAWPSIKIEPAIFLPYVAQHLSIVDGVKHGLEQLYAEDIYLACACAAGDRAAMGHFEQQLFGEIDTALRYRKCDKTMIEEVKQELRLLLFVEQDGKPAKIRQYSGRGHLRHWLRMVGVRKAGRLMRRSGKELPADEDFFDLATPSGDLELSHLKQEYRAEFKQAFGSALRSLSSRDRNLLRYQYIDGLNIDEMGRIYGVHRATVARWLARIRQALLNETKQQMMSALKIKQSDFESIYRMIESRLEVSIQRYLGLDPGGEGFDS